MRQVFFRADGDSSIGMGHLMRCISLGEMLSGQFECTLITRVSNPMLSEEAERVGIRVVDLSLCETVRPYNHSTKESALEWLNWVKTNSVVVFDGYHFTNDLILEVKARGAKAVQIADVPLGYYLCDAVIDHAPFIDRSLFDCSPETELFLGSEYTMIRREFLVDGPPQNSEFLLVGFGGADPDKWGPRIAELLCVLTNEKIVLLSSHDVDSKDGQVTVRWGLDERVLIDLFSKTKLAFVSASTMLLELISQRIPVAAGTFVANQKLLYSGCVSSKACFAMGDLNKNKLETEVTRILELSQDQSIMNDQKANQAKLIDHESPNRIREIFSSI